MNTVNIPTIANISIKTLIKIGLIPNTKIEIIPVIKAFKTIPPKKLFALP